MASTYLTRTPSSTGNRKTFTISVWVKRSELSTNQKIFEASPDGSSRTEITFKTTDELQFYAEVGGVTKYNLKSNAKLRDTNGFYHIVCAVDTTQSTSSNRVKMYINGEQITSLDINVYPDQNFDTLVNLSSQINVIGRRNPYSDFYFNGVMSHFHLIDGTAYDATAFGETDSTTGEWQINTAPSVTYGTNGFFILKDGNSVTDQSGNSNNFTVGGGSLTKTEDCPDNVFATFNPLYSGGAVYSNGNLTSTISLGSNKFGGVSTIGVSSGKWYAEFKALSDTTNNIAVGIYGQPGLASNNNQAVGKETDSIGYRSDGSKGIENTFSSYGVSYTTNDIIGVALDLDSGTKTITFYKNGASQGAITISLTPDEGFWFLSANSADGGKSGIWSANFGNGYFGTTAVASAGTNASGIGIFEYDVPAGFTALSTKGLNE